MQKNKKVILENFKINIRFEKVLANLKFRQSINDLDKNLEIYISKEIQKFYQDLKNIAVYRIEKKEDCDCLYKDSQDVEKLLYGCEWVVVFAVSIGKNIDKKIEKHLNIENEKNVMAAALLDSIGSEAVEQCANYINDYIRKNAINEDFLTTKRYSAGYGDWDMKENLNIFKFLELDKSDMKINESGLFYPQKTITAIMGLKKR